MNRQLTALFSGDKAPVVAKMSGTGNDFIVIDHRQKIIAPELQPELARLLCRRKFSLGADGLILIEEGEGVDFQWQFYNADGSVAEMCGNGARCAARYAHDLGLAGESMRFMTLAGVIEAEMVGGDVVRLRMTAPQDIVPPRPLEVEGTEMEVSSINTGVPHAVCFVDDIAQVDVARWGRSIRFHERYAPAGTNVNFAQVSAPGRLYIRTYERGVEGETLACGTGAVACAITAGLLKGMAAPLELVTSGGESLTIHFTLKDEGRRVEDVFLEGPAHIVYEAKVREDAFVEPR